MKKIFSNITSVAVIASASVAVLGIALLNKTVAYVQEGLSDSASIRVSDKTTCDVEGQDSGTKFSGCNSIL